MVEVPRHLSQHERAARLPLVTRSGTVTRIEAMDHSRNDEVRRAIRRELEAADQPDALAAVRRHSADYDWDRLYERLRNASVPAHRIREIQTLAGRFERPYPSLISLRVRPDEPVDFAPGQYVTLRSRDTPRAYSLASSPTDDELEFAIRRVPGGRLTGQLYDEVSAGDDVVVRGPNGHMVLDDPSPRDAIFLATGTGVAPFKSMIDFLFEQGWDEHEGHTRQVWLFLGCGWLDDLPYHEEFSALAAERENFHYVPTLSRERLLTDWEGETDYAQRILVKYLEEEAVANASLPKRLAPFASEAPSTDVEARIDPTNVALYACGITAMVSTLVRAARAVGVDPADMQYEGFG